MFLGEYQHTIDEKGRMAVPVKFRYEVASGAVVTRGIDKCLFLFPKTEWEKIAPKIANLPLPQANSRAFSRLMLAGAMEVDLDKQGRLILPDYCYTPSAPNCSAILSLSFSVACLYFPHEPASQISIRFRLQYQKMEQSVC